MPQPLAEYAPKSDPVRATPTGDELTGRARKRGFASIGTPIADAYRLKEHLSGRRSPRFETPIRCYFQRFRLLSRSERYGIRQPLLLRAHGEISPLHDNYLGEQKSPSLQVLYRPQTAAV